MIQDGGDAAQFATLRLTVSKPDQPGKSLSEPELKSLLSSPEQSADVGAILQVRRMYFNPGN